MAYSFTKHLVVALLLVTCLHVLAACELVDTAKAERHERWMVKHGRVYADDAEKARRLEVYKANVAFIESVNAGNHKFWLGENQFADLTNAEFMAMTTGFKPSRANRAPTAFRYANINADDLPASIDWRTKGAVTPVKNQGHCRSCWAFSSVASMEGIVKLRTGRLISLSEQELVDCAVNGGDRGCEGGLMDYAFKFIIKNGGLTTESDYPYTAKQDKCTIRSNSAATIKAYVNVPANDEAALQKAVANQPVSIALDGTDQHFQFYKGGILSGGCGTDLNHAVTAVGYGVSSDGTKYWLMKNSWGTSWGEDGYIRMERAVADKEGVCGLAMLASYPIA